MPLSSKSTQYIEKTPMTMNELMIHENHHKDNTIAVVHFWEGFSSFFDVCDGRAVSVRE